MMKYKAFLTVCLLWVVSILQAQDYSAYYQNLPTKVAQAMVPTFPANEVTITDFGAVGDGQTLCTEAFRKAISLLTKQGGGTVQVPAGVWLTGPIALKSNIRLNLAHGAIIYFSADKRLYIDQDGKSSRVDPCIRASKCKNIAITGHGIIDGNGAEWRPVKRSKVSDVEWKGFIERLGGVEQTEKGLWYPWNHKAGYANIADTPEKQEGMRNDLFRPTDCENIFLQGVTFQNAPRFHVHPCYSSNIIIDGITVRCPWNAQNGDGIDLSDCHRALIVNSTVDVGDDGICMKSGGEKKGLPWGCEDILITNNTVFHAHGGFVIGSEDIGGMHRLVVRNNQFSGTDTGLRFKSAIGRGGVTGDVFISDIFMSDITNEAIIFECDYANRPAGGASQGPQKDSPLVPHFQDIHIDRVVCHGAKVGIKASGVEGMDCVKDIFISNSSITYWKTAQDINTATAKLTLQNVKLQKEGEQK